MGLGPELRQPRATYTTTRKHYVGTAQGILRSRCAYPGLDTFGCMTDVPSGTGPSDAAIRPSEELITLREAMRSRRAG